jgi:hypothetical protein
MPIDPALRALMIETVTIEPMIGQNGHGEEVFGPPVVYEQECRVQYEKRTVTVQATVAGQGFGRTLIMGARVYIASAPEVGLRDRLTLPDGTQPKILEAHRHSDESGPHHTEIVC